MKPKQTRGRRIAMAAFLPTVLLASGSCGANQWRVQMTSKPHSSMSMIADEARVRCSVSRITYGPQIQSPCPDQLKQGPSLQYNVLPIPSRLIHIRRSSMTLRLPTHRFGDSLATRRSRESGDSHMQTVRSTAFHLPGTVVVPCLSCKVSTIGKMTFNHNSIFRNRSPHIILKNL